MSWLDLKYIFQFINVEERDHIVSLHSDKTLIEEKNIVEGNFLVFSNNPENDSKTNVEVFVNIPQLQFEDQKNKVYELEANFMYDSMMKDLAMEQSMNQQADMMYQLMIKGVL